MSSVPYFDFALTVLIAALFGFAFLTSRKTSGGGLTLLTVSVFGLGAYTLASRGLYMASQGANLVALLPILLSLPPLAWLLAVRLPAKAATDVMGWFVWGCATAALAGTALSLAVFGQGLGAREIWSSISMDVISNRNDLALMYVIGLGAVLLLDLGNSKLVNWLIAGVLIFSVLFSFSRSAYTAIALLLVFIFISKREVRIPAIAILAVIAMSALVQGSPIGDRIAYTFEGRGSYSLDDSSAFRFYIWNSAFELFKTSPIFGVGSTHPPIPLEYSNDAMIIYAHNYFLTQLFQLGFIGFILTALMFVSLVRNTIRKARDLRVFGLAAVAVIVVASLTGDPLYGVSIYLFYILVSSLTCDRQRKVARAPVRRVPPFARRASPFYGRMPQDRWTG